MSVESAARENRILSANFIIEYLSLSISARFDQTRFSNPSLKLN